MLSGIKRGQVRVKADPKHRPGVRRAAFQLEMTQTG